MAWVIAYPLRSNYGVQLFIPVIFHRSRHIALSELLIIDVLSYLVLYARYFQLRTYQLTQADRYEANIQVLMYVDYTSST